MNITNRAAALTNYVNEIRRGLPAQSSFLMLIVLALSTASLSLLLLSF